MPSRIGLHAGELNGCYYAGSIIATPLWGLLSDKVGRRPILLSGASRAPLLLFVVVLQ